MTHTSRLFGEFTYEEDQVITFPGGLLGFPDYRHYVLKGNPNTAPSCWLLSVDEGGPEVALIDPEMVDKDYSLRNLKLDNRELKRLQCEHPEELLRYSIVTLPENIKKISMNLRAPVFIDPITKRGIQWQAPGYEKRPVRCFIYHDLISSRPEDRQGMLIMLRKENETIEIGDEISIQVLEFANGGVRLAVNAPKNVSVTRGKEKVTSKCETRRADKTMNVNRLEGIMRMHQIMQSDEESLSATADLNSEIDDREVS